MAWVVVIHELALIIAVGALIVLGVSALGEAAFRIRMAMHWAGARWRKWFDDTEENG